MSPHGPFPTRSVSSALLDRVGVEYDGIVYRARDAGNSVLVECGRVQPGEWAQVDNDSLTIRLGSRAADVLDQLVPGSDYERVQVAATILASVCGHPRGKEPGEALSFVWSDHIALVSGGGITLRTAFEISDVKTPQPYWLKSMEGHVRVIDLETSDHT